MIKKQRSVKFHFLSPAKLPSRGILKAFIQSLFKKENCSFQELNIIFCDDDYLLALNKRFLQHNYYTDILSFPLSERGEPLVAEIYISIQRIRENAGVEGVSFRNELHRVIFHGILHFCGYKDKSASDTKKMREKEDHYLSTYNRRLGLKQHSTA